MSSISGEARAARLAQVVDEDKIVSARVYNLVLCATVLYGLVVNALLCRADVILFVFSRISYRAFLIIYLICAFAGVFISRRSRNALVSFLGYNLIVLPVGLLVAATVIMGGYNYSVVGHAFITTAGVTVIMTTAGLLFPQFFEKIGSVLFFGLLGVLLTAILSRFIPGISMGVTMVSAGLFSLYIGFDVYRSQQFPRTIDNAVDCAVDIYLDIINLFLNLLRIFGKSKD